MNEVLQASAAHRGAPVAHATVSTLGLRWWTSLRRRVHQMVDCCRTHLTWLKPPYRTAARCAAYLFSTWNIWRAGEIRRVNVGCACDTKPGWWNLDLIHYPGVDELRDATRPWRHRDLEFVYAEHFIEHLSLLEAIDFLKHAGNALRVGGTIRLSTPNLSWVLPDCYDATCRDLPTRLRDTIDINGCFHGYGHKFLFSAELLKFILGELGFAGVRECPAGSSGHQLLCNLERHGPFEETGGVPSLIIVEADRSTAPIGPSPALAALIDRHFVDGVYR